MPTDNVTEKRARLSPAKLALLEQRLRGADGLDTDRPRLQKRPSDGNLPLSFAQERFWFLNQMEPGAAYNISVAFRLSGELNVAALEKAIDAIVARHEILRTSFALVENETVQIINPPTSQELPREDLSSLSGLPQASELRRIANLTAKSAFDLARYPLFRFCLLRLSSVQHLLLFTIHHIISDASSVEMVFRELAQLYNAYRRGEDSPLPGLKFQYADHALWQRQMLQDEALAKQLAYWRERLSGAPPMLNLPTDKPRPAKLSFRGAQQSLNLSTALSDALATLAQRESATLFMVLLAAFNVLLHRYTSQDDILVGCPIAGRNDVETESLMGCLVNTLVMVGDLSGDPSFRDVLRRTRNNSLEAFSNQDVPFEKLVQDLQPPRRAAHSPFFQVLFNFNRSSSKGVAEPDWCIENLDIDRGAARADLLLAIEEQKGALECTLEYSTDLFEPETISRMLGHFEVLLAEVVRDPDVEISKVPLLTNSERHQLLDEWNKVSQSNAQSATCLHLIFEKQTELTPNAVALVSGDESLTYRQLNDRANELAHSLMGHGVRPEMLVGLCLERSLGLVVSVLGILKAGAAYLPLDPSYPPDRLAFMIEDSRTGILVTQEDLLEKFPIDGVNVLIVAADGALVERAGPASAAPAGVAQNTSRQNPQTYCGKQNLAYVIYTSGSTGKPKGVLVTHENVLRLFDTTNARFGFSSDDVWTMFHSSAFDFSVWEIWGALLYGGRLVVVPYLVSRSPTEFFNLLVAERVTVLNQTPSAFRQLIPVDQDADRDSGLSLRLVIFGGEALELNSLRPWFDRHGDEAPQLVNMYGITETTVHVTYRPLQASELTYPIGSMIGRALDDLQVYILDRHQQLLPIGVPGELYVGGAGLGRGYLNQAALTAQRFVPHLFSETPGARLYRTGDLGRYHRNGDIEYLGRVDRQVKIRGFRIELGEIETLLTQHELVRECHVVSRETPEDRQLVAYVVPETEQTPDTETLRSFLKGVLPPYMVPASFVWLDCFPLTPNGKIDGRSLPQPETPASGTAFVPPRTASEEKLAAIWAEILKVEKVGIHDDFFDLGGHSLLATQLVSRVRDSLGLELTLGKFFAAPTIEGVMAFLAKSKEARDDPGAMRITRVGRQVRQVTISESGSLLRRPDSKTQN